jgi:probable HAF family extracellular repeat protein
LNSVSRYLVSTFICALPLSGAVAADTKMDLNQIEVSGNANVQATSINDKGLITAVLYEAGSSAGTGLIIDGSNVTTLPAPDAGANGVYPIQISDDGKVLGWNGEATFAIPHLFRYSLKKAAYLPSHGVILNMTYTDHSAVFPLGEDRRGDIFINVIQGRDAPVKNEYGPLKALQQAPFEGRAQILRSLNDSGYVAGDALQNDSGASQVFVGSGGSFVYVTPPGSTSAKGGYVNDSHDVAGAYTDAAGAEHGFVYSAGQYTTFDMPQAATSVTVTGFNNKGRVVGSYTSTADGKQHGFIYNGSAVSSIGSFKTDGTVSVALNKRSDMVVTINSSRNDESPDYLSYQVSCTGPGC